ncbi:MAG TPA: TonB-dependent receptor [Hyphomonadaceae bacterium]|nr:TonB-dependent receptor [Hyphomonadaceae bacterium]
MKFTRSPLGLFLLATTALFAPHALAQDAPAAPAQPADQQAADVIVVQGRFIPEPLQETSEVAAFLSEEDLARTGDSDAAAALSRVTGLSVVDSKFVYVRGLGERYSSALLNGSPLPSPEPLQRVVPLDLFPSSVLSGVMVQKSYSAEFPGEFGGGVINLTTKGIPDENFLEIGIGSSVNTETTFATGYTYDGGGVDDMWGFDNGVRKVPNQLKEAWAAGQRVDASLNLYPTISNAAERQRIGQSFENAKLRLVQLNDQIPINGSSDISGGRIWDFNDGDVRLGMVGVLGYSNDWQTRDGRRQSAAIAGTAIVPGDNYNFTATTNDIGWDGLLNAGLEFGDNSVTFTNLWVRRTSKLAQEQFGFNSGNGDFILRERTGWYERQLTSSQLAGKFDLGDLEINWRGAYAKTERNAPYEWSMSYVFDPAINRYLSGNNNTSNETRFSELDDEVASAGIDLKYDIPMDGVRDMEITGGIAHSDNSRASETRSYIFVPNTLSRDQQQQRVDFLLADFNIGPDVGQFQLTEATGNIENAPAYASQLEVDGVYAKVDFEPILYLRTALGARWEKAIETVQLIDFYGPEPLPNKIKKDYILPSATVTWNFAEDQQLRLGISRTIGRPQFRELAPQPYYDPDTDRFLRGNPFLLDTIFKNFDGRYEWFFDKGQFFTLGAFYKDIQRPVDSIASAAGGSTTQTTFNAPAAELMGAEIELRKVFSDPIPNMPLIGGKDIFLQANYTYSTAEVKVSPSDRVLVQLGTQAVSDQATFYITDGARLLGQSDHVANLQFGWEDPAGGQTGTFIATYVSERATTRAVTSGGLKSPDFTEEPGIMLDFVFKQEFESFGGIPTTLDLKIQNILGTEHQEVQTFDPSGTFQGGEVTINGYQRGTTFSAKVSARF